MLDTFARWRRPTGRCQAPAVASETGLWQKSLRPFTAWDKSQNWRSKWMEPVTPLAAPRTSGGAADDHQREVTLTLAAGDAGDGNDRDSWSGNGPDSSRRDVPTCRSATSAPSSASVRPSARGRSASRRTCLDAAAEASAAQEPIELGPLARQHAVEPAILAAWLDYLGIGMTGAAVKIDSLLLNKITNASGYELRPRLGPSGNAEPRRQLVRSARPDSRQPQAAQHRDASLADAAQSAAGWRPPVATTVRVVGLVHASRIRNAATASPGLWSASGRVRQALAAGIAHGRRTSRWVRCRAWPSSRAT